MPDFPPVEAEATGGFDPDTWDYVIIDPTTVGYSSSLTGSGAISRTANEINLNTGATINSYANLVMGPVADFGRKLIFECFVTFGSIVTQEARFGIGRPYLSTANLPRAIFRIVNAAVYAQVADGSGTTTLDLSYNIQVSTSRVYAFKVIWYPGVKAEYYIDGVLKGTITTNLPAATEWTDLFAFMLTNTAASDHALQFCGCCVGRLKRTLG